MKKLTTSFASIAMLVHVFAPVAAASSIELEVSGNGAESQNTTVVTSENNTVVSQTNSANITNTVNANSNTGGNNASKNTGGAVTVDTGDSKTVVAVENNANSNTADVTNCGACNTDATVKITGNGADSKNAANLQLNAGTVVAQTNNGSILNAVKADSNTGANNANKNTGGDVEVSTGNALTHVDLSTTANSNWAKVGGIGHSNGDVSLMISGNGAESKNDILLKLDRDVLLQQKNSASVKNWVDAEATTGDNRANKNTGGDVRIDTGDALTGVAVDNAVNFNWANVDCDCLTDVTAKVAGNGFGSVNKISAALSDDRNIFQENSCGYGYGNSFLFGRHHRCGVDNVLNADSATGYNDSDKNTGEVGSDPEILTGDSETLVGVENTGNSNTYGTTPSMPSNGIFGGVNLNISFNLGDLLSALGLLS